MVYEYRLYIQIKNMILLKIQFHRVKSCKVEYHVIKTLLDMKGKTRPHYNAKATRERMRTLVRLDIKQVMSIRLWSMFSHPKSWCV